MVLGIFGLSRLESRDLMDGPLLGVSSNEDLGGRMVPFHPSSPPLTALLSAPGWERTGLLNTASKQDRQEFR